MTLQLSPNGALSHRGYGQLARTVEQRGRQVLQIL
jgi:hypothetical protein